MEETSIHVGSSEQSLATEMCQLTSTIRKSTRLIIKVWLVVEMKCQH